MEQNSVFVKRVADLNETIQSASQSNPKPMSRRYVTQPVAIFYRLLGYCFERGEKTGTASQQIGDYGEAAERRHRQIRVHNVTGQAGKRMTKQVSNRHVGGRVRGLVSILRGGQGRLTASGFLISLSISCKA